MSKENMELVTRGVRAGLARPEPDFATINEVFHPDHLLVPVTTLDTDEVRGGTGFRSFMHGLGQGGDSDSAAEATTSWEADLEGAVDVGRDKVLCVLTTRLHGSASGLDVEQRHWLVTTVRDGRVSQTEVYSDPAKALEAAARRE